MSTKLRRFPSSNTQNYRDTAGRPRYVAGCHVRSSFVRPIALAMLLSVTELVSAQERDAISLSLEQLVNVEVYSASKFNQKAADAPGSLTVAIPASESQRNIKRVCSNPLSRPTYRQPRNTAAPGSDCRS